MVDSDFTKEAKDYVLVKLLTEDHVKKYQQTKKFSKYYNKFLNKFSKILPVSSNEEYIKYANLCALLSRYVKIDVDTLVIYFLNNNLNNYLFEQFNKFDLFDNYNNNATIILAYVNKNNEIYSPVLH